MKINADCVQFYLCSLWSRSVKCIAASCSHTMLSGTREETRMRVPLPPSAGLSEEGSPSFHRPSHSKHDLNETVRFWILEATLEAVSLSHYRTFWFISVVYGLFILQYVPVG